MATLTATQKRQMKRLEDHHAEHAKAHEELRQMLADLHQTFDEQQAIVDELSSRPGDEHREEIAALSTRIERVKLGAQSSWARLADLEQKLAESQSAIETLSAKFAATE